MSRKQILFSYFWALCWIAASSVASSAQELSKLPFVPTPQIVVDEMLKMANVRAGDFVVDLGSGDGRMIITAAKTFKASGLGVDIDGKLVDHANNLARNELVSDRAKFIEQDMFKTDIRKATVITLYVLPDFMEKLRPKLLKELRPGARIVAHDYYIIDWHPDRQVELTVPEKVQANGTDKAYLYLWIVPAVVQGDWRMDFDAGDGKPQLVVLSFNQRYQIVSAAAANRGGALKIERPMLLGDEITFALTVSGTTYQFGGRVVGDRLEGNFVSAVGGKATPWRATKLPPEK
jgi:hypothetical protein